MTIQLLIKNSKNQFNNIDNLIAENNFLKTSFSSYLHSDEIELETVNLISQFLKRRIDVISECTDLRVKNQELKKFEEIINVVNKISNELRSAPLQTLAPPTRSAAAVEYPWLIVSSMSSMADRALLAQVNKLTNRAVAQDPAYQIVKSLKMICNERIETAKELNQLLEPLNLPKNDIEIKNIKDKIRSSYQTEFEIKPEYSQENEKLISFLDEHYFQLSPKSKVVINEFVLDNLIDTFEQKELKLLYRLQQHALQKWFINLPSQKHLELALIRLEKAGHFRDESYKYIVPPEDLPIVKRQIEIVEKLLGPICNGYEDVYKDHLFPKYDLATGRDQIAKELNDPLFMKSLFFLKKHTSRYRSVWSEDSLIDDLFEGQPPIENRELVESIFRYEPRVLKFASSEILTDIEFILHLNQKYWNGDRVIEFVKDLCKVEEFVLPFIQKNGMSLQYLSDSLKDNLKVVLPAVEECGCALKFASARLQDNRDIVLAAVKNFPHAIKFANVKFKEDKEVIISGFAGFLRGGELWLHCWSEDHVDDFYNNHIAPRLQKDPAIIELYQRARSMYLLASTAQVLKDHMLINNKTKAKEVMKEAKKFILLEKEIKGYLNP